MIFKYINGILKLIFNKKVTEKWVLWVHNRKIAEKVTLYILFIFQSEPAYKKKGKKKKKNA